MGDGAYLPQPKTHQIMFSASLGVITSAKLCLQCVKAAESDIFVISNQQSAPGSWLGVAGHVGSTVSSLSLGKGCGSKQRGRGGVLSLCSIPAPRKGRGGSAAPGSGMDHCGAGGGWLLALVLLNPLALPASSAVWGQPGEWQPVCPPWA